MFHVRSEDPIRFGITVKLHPYLFSSLNLGLLLATRIKFTRCLGVGFFGALTCLAEKQNGLCYELTLHFLSSEKSTRQDSQRFYLFKILRAHILPLTNCAFNKSLESVDLILSTAVVFRYVLGGCLRGVCVN